MSNQTLINITATPTLLPSLFVRASSAAVNLQFIANRAYLFDSEGSNLSGTGVALDQGEPFKGFYLHADGEFLRVAYVNNIKASGVSGLRISYYDSYSLEEESLIEFNFSEPVETPAWGVWSLEFKIEFTS